ncbi:MAG TPA: class I SAM-dependent methyltransferase [Usitatibacter sp.]|jgi:demethylmenaquinone methyltransferase/2-methoxy-6-polyprenyl-1,4-benzoquinol methylase|nr:class I SAM-dependent methyltransferase [Usitatibacter sp.]
MSETTAAPTMERYYARRAAEYERIYDKPERQAELEWLRERVPAVFRGREVLEIACGTGYWTQYIAREARRVRACDINEAVLDIAREKPIAPGRAEFFRADALTLEGVPEGCDAAFAGFWWSHVKKAELRGFIARLDAKLKRGSVIAILDNTFVEGSSTPMSRRDADGNTYQVRKLANGDDYEVVKNFPTEDELREAVAEVAAEAHLESLRYYWLLVFRTK